MIPIALAIAVEVSDLRARLSGGVLYVPIRPVGLRNELSAQYAHYGLTSLW